MTTTTQTRSGVRLSERERAVLEAALALGPGATPEAVAARVGGWPSTARAILDRLRSFGVLPRNGPARS